MRATFPCRSVSGSVAIAANLTNRGAAQLPERLGTWLASSLLMVPAAAPPFTLVAEETDIGALVRRAAGKREPVPVVREGRSGERALVRR